MKPLLTCALIEPDQRYLLTDFFAKLRNSTVVHSFHPHPFTAAEAERISFHVGKDLYAGVFLNGSIIAYGMLRGWDEGFSIPSLGIVVDPDHQRMGIGGLMMSYLHCLAKGAGAQKVRLKVYASNTTAVKLYEHHGYSFEGEEKNQLVAYKNL